MQKQVLIVIGIIISVAIILGGAFLYMQKSQIPVTNVQSNPNVSASAKATADKQNSNTQTADWKIFDSGDGFEFKYPVIKESFITFSSPEIIRGNANINNGGCFTGNTNYPNPVKEKTKILINNNQFCISTTSDSGMGFTSITYFYTTTYDDGNHFTLVFPFETKACLKENTNYESCQNFFNNDSYNKTYQISNEILSTFNKFKK